MTKQEMVNELYEVRHEIRRLNEAAGHTVFNPAATVGLDRVLLSLGQPLYPNKKVEEVN